MCEIHGTRDSGHHKTRRRSRRVLRRPEARGPCILFEKMYMNMSSGKWPPFRHWGHARRHGKRSLEMLIHVVGLPWCVKYMARGTPGTTKPDGEAGGFCGDRRPEGHVFHTSRQAMIKTYYSTSIRIRYGTNCSYFTTNKVNNDGNRWQQSTTEQDWAWLFSGSDGSPNFDL